MKKTNKVFVGRSLYSRDLHISLDDDRMMFTFASTRGGKGATTIIPNLLLWPGSVVVIDPKGTNAMVTARRRRDMKQDVYVFDPFDEIGPQLAKTGRTFREVFGKERSDSLNPLAGLNINSPTLREDIAVISDALVVPDAVQKDPHWDDGAKTGVGGFIDHIISAPEYRQNRSLPIIREFLASDARTFAELLVTMSGDQKAEDPARAAAAGPASADSKAARAEGRPGGAAGLARDAASRFIRGIHTDEIQNILSNLDKHTDWLSSRVMQNIFAQSEPTFSFAKLRERPTTVYLIIPPRFLDVHKRFLRLFVNLTLKEVAQGGRSGIPILLLLDEFQQLGKMPEVVKAYRLLAGYNCCLWCFAQDWPGMVELYGSEANTFISQSRAVQVFSLNDLDSLELVSKQIGARCSRRDGGNSPRTVPLRMPDEVSKEISRESDKQYLLRAGAPLILERVRYYEDQDSLLARLLIPRERYWPNGGASWLASPVRALQAWLRKRYFPFYGMYDPDPDYASPAE